MKATKLLPLLLLAFMAGKLDVNAAPPPAGSQVIESKNITVYPAGWSQPKYRLEIKKNLVVFFSGCGDIGIARTRDLDAVWQLDKDSVLSGANRIENTSIYYQPSDKTWWLFTNHINSGTDAIWVYWTKDLDHWNADDKAVVLDANNCKWSKNLIGLPSVIMVGVRLAIGYDGQSDPKDGLRDGDNEPPAVDAGNLIALLADHEAAAVVLFLEAVVAVVEQTLQLAAVHGIEELATDAAVIPLVARLLAGSKGASERPVAFGDF